MNYKIKQVQFKQWWANTKLDQNIHLDPKQTGQWPMP